MYRTFRTIHLLLASFSLPFLLMYAVSAVQMTHSEWFDLKPTIHEDTLPLAPGLDGARMVARDVMERRSSVRGELSAIQTSPTGSTFRIVVPGTVHEIKYVRATGTTTIKTSIAGVMGMLNRLHHAAGFWHEPLDLKMWAVLVFIVSVALLLLGATGLCMWFVRRTERRAGAVLLAVNLLFVVILLVTMRGQGP